MDEDLAKAVAGVYEVLKLLGEFGDLCLWGVVVLVYEDVGLPAELAAEVVKAQLYSRGFVLLDELGGEGVLAVELLEQVV